MGQAYLAGNDPQALTRTWQDVLAAIIACKPEGSEARYRWGTFSKDQALNRIRTTPLLKTTPEMLLATINRGTVSTNVFLRRTQNFALDMGWLPWPVLRKKQFPKVRYGPKRAITEDEHGLIVEREQNPERRDFYELCWLLGGSQGDIARLGDEDMNWDDRLICYNRKKMLQRMQENPNLKPDDQVRRQDRGSAEAAARQRAALPLPLHRAVLRQGHRVQATVPGPGHRGRHPPLLPLRLGRARPEGPLPQQCAQENLGQQSAAVHRAYAKNAGVSPSPPSTSGRNWSPTKSWTSSGFPRWRRRCVGPFWCHPLPRRMPLFG